jgi:NADH-quinone oxidoreductase subunit H
MMDLQFFLWLLIVVVKIVVIFAAVLTVVAYLSYAERRIGGFMQDRLGPNRVGPFGLFQPIADGLKFMFKEDFVPAKANKILHAIAPAIIMGTAIIALSVIPFGSSIEIGRWKINLIISDIDAGILFLLALGGLSLYGIIIGGWASNNKYSLLGALRSASQLLSYETTMALSVLSTVLIFGTLSLYGITELQTSNPLKWGIVKAPLSFLLFLITAFAETNRVPFDLPEADSELVAGYHTEYSGMKFAMFFMAEYTHMIVASSVIVALYFGGWQVPFLSQQEMISSVGQIGAFLLSVISFSIKTGLFLFFFIWIRWTLPRFRFDQLINLGWKVLLPIAILNLLITAGVVIYA